MCAVIPVIMDFLDFVPVHFAAQLRIRQQGLHPAHARFFRQYRCAVFHAHVGCNTVGCRHVHDLGIQLVVEGGLVYRTAAFLDLPCDVALGDSRALLPGGLYGLEIQVVRCVEVDTAWRGGAIRIPAAVCRGLYRAQRDVAHRARDVDVLCVERGADQRGVGIFGGEAGIVIRRP